MTGTTGVYIVRSLDPSVIGLRRAYSDCSGFSTEMQNSCACWYDRAGVREYHDGYKYV